MTFFQKINILKINIKYCSLSTHTALSLHSPINFQFNFIGQSLTPEKFHNTLGVTTVHEFLTPTQGFGVEFFSTFTLVLVVFGVCDENRNDIKGSAPLAIGLTVTTAILATVSPQFVSQSRFMERPLCADNGPTLESRRL